jgi:uncharacterized membrane protein
MQSILVFLPLTIIAPLIGWIGAPKLVTRIGPNSAPYPYWEPGISALVWLSWIIYATIIILWIIFIIMSYQGQRFKIPIVGDIAEKQI